MNIQLTMDFDSLEEMNKVVGFLNKFEDGDGEPNECDRPTPKSEPKSKKSEVVEKPKTLNDVSKLAQGLLETIDRAVIKKTISKYGERISEVDESDYNSLYSDLLKLKG